MEEDIKVLEEYLNYEVTKRKLSGCEILAIEHIIARNKELEEKNFYLPAWVGKNYIPKSKVREKIEEIKKDENPSISSFQEYAQEYSIKKLQELLLEGDK